MDSHPNVAKNDLASTSETLRLGSQVKFHEILTALIEGGPYSKNRRPIWEHAGVTSAALSQYVSGKAKPRLDTLALLAEFFGVTLDYLVLGRQAPVRKDPQARAMDKYVDWALADMQVRAGTHTWLVTRIAHVLATQIDSAAQSLLPAVTQVGGLITDHDSLVLERMSRHCKLVSLNPGYDIVELGDTRVAGRYARVVAENLAQKGGCRYDYLIADSTDFPWKDIVYQYRRLMSDLGVSDRQWDQCVFRKSAQPILASASFYQLDVPRFQSEEPLMYEALREFISNDNWVGLTLHQDSQTLGGLLYDIRTLERTLPAFNNLWNNALPI